MFGSSWDDPKTAAVLAMSQGLLGQRGMGGLLSGAQGYLGAMQAAKDKERALALEALKSKLLQAQIGETEAQAAERKAHAERMTGAGAAIDQLLNRPAAAGQPGLALGGVRVPMSPQAGGLAGASIEDVVRAKAQTGIDFLDAWKAAQTGLKQEAGNYYVRNGQREYLADPAKGFSLVDGRASLLPGFTDAQAALTGATKGAEEAAKAPYTPFSFTGPGNTPMTTTLDRFRAELAAQDGGGQPRYAPAPTTPQGATGRLADVQRAEDDIRRWAESLRPGGAGAAASVAAGPAGIKTGLGPADKWTYDRERGLMVNDAGQSRPVTNADNVPIGSPKEASEAQNNNKFLEATKIARSLLAKGPTGSTVGTLVDSAAGVFGKAPPGAAEAAQLRTVSGWLTSNVPRMEGPQSNYDVQNYREMAALVGDSTKPISVRLAALDTAEGLIKKYGDLNKASAANPGLRDATGGAVDLQSAIAAELARRQRQTFGATGSW